MGRYSRSQGFTPGLLSLGLSPLFCFVKNCWWHIFFFPREIKVSIGPVLILFYLCSFLSSKKNFNRFQIIICAKFLVAWPMGLCAQRDKITLYVTGKFLGRNTRGAGIWTGFTLLLKLLVLYSCILQTLTAPCQTLARLGMHRDGEADHGSQQSQHGDRMRGEANLLLNQNMCQQGIDLLADNSKQEQLGLGVDAAPTKEAKH